MSLKGRSKSNKMQPRNVCAYIDPRTRTDHLTLSHFLRCIDAGHSSPPTFISACRSETTERVWKQIRGWYLPQSPCDLIPHSNLWHLWEAAELNQCPVYAQSVLPSTAVCVNIWTAKIQCAPLKKHQTPVSCCALFAGILFLSFWFLR